MVRSASDGRIADAYREEGVAAIGEVDIGAVVFKLSKQIKQTFRPSKGIEHLVKALL